MTRYLLFLHLINKKLSPKSKRALYLIVLYLLKVLSFCFYAKVYPRNSFLQTYFIPGQSDLDITVIYCTDNYMNQKIHVVLLKFLQVIFPFVAEINFIDKYFIHNLSWWSTFDLCRDPVLHKIGGDDSEYGRLFFLLKKIGEDLDFFRYELRDRRPKWKYYLDIARYDLSLETITKFLSQLFLLLQDKIDISYDNFYNYYYGEKNNSILLWCLNPFVAIQSSCIPWETITNKQKQLVECALRWEMAGVLTQYRIGNISACHIEQVEKVAVLLGKGSIVAKIKQHIEMA